MSAAELLRAFLDAYNAHDVDAAVALYAPDGEHREIAQGAVRRGHADLLAGLTHFLAAFPDARWQVDRTVADAQTAVATYTLGGTLRQRLGPFEPAGQRVELPGTLVLARGEDGRIAWSADYWDAATFGRQMAVQ